LPGTTERLSWSCSAPQSIYRRQLAPVSVRCSPRVLRALAPNSRVFTGSGVRIVSKKSIRHPLASFRSPSESSRCRAANRSQTVSPACSLSAPPLRFSPLQRLLARDSGFCGRACLTQPPAPSGFRNPLTPSSAPNLLALFHARSALGVSPFRDLLLPCSRAPSPAPLPSCRWSALPNQPGLPSSTCSRTLRPSPSQALPNAPRLQGFAPHESPPRRAGCLDRQGHVSLMGLLPPGSSPTARSPSLHSASPHELSRSAASDLTPAPQGLARAMIGWLLSELPTLMGFLAS
jgi:hypothetical protein